uniref:F-box domain-containing protein n=1 Tax=Caenorhabditis japonica TaxID=281687 RepID=A0A8R1HPY6_CAEJA
MDLPCDLWEKLSYTLAEHPPSLCVMAKASRRLQKIVGFVISHYEAHLHITYPKNECCNVEKTSEDRVQFEMILNRKGNFRRGKAHCHSIFTCAAHKIDIAIDDILQFFSDELITLRFNNVPEDSDVFTVFNKRVLPKCEDICFNGSVPVHNGVFDMFQACRNSKRLVISKPPEATDFNRFWPLLKGSRLESLDLMHADSLATLLYAAKWQRVYIHSETALHAINSNLYKPLDTLTEFCYSSKAFTVDYVISFLKKCEAVKCFNWYGLHSCVAPIVISRLLTGISRNIVFGGCVACKSGETVGNGGFMEVGNRVNVVQVTKLLEREDFRAVYGKTLADAVLFERPFSSVSVMYIQKKDSVCGPNCIDIHEISQKAGILL